MLTYLDAGEGSFRTAWCGLGIELPPDIRLPEGVSVVLRMRGFLETGRKVQGKVVLQEGRRVFVPSLRWEAGT
jgi:hypothetical protein